MPGSVQISVLGLMDLALPPPLSSLSLTVTMGKKEYRTVGGGELSLPVVSLRENLIVMVHDAEGEEILRTEFRTMLLLERRLWDDLFPLKNGGSLHMKLQFLLSEEDRKRIREMRDSAQKRRHMEKSRTRHRRSFSDNKIGYLPTRTITENVTKGMILDHSETADPIVEPSFGQSEKFHAYRIGMGDFARSAVIGEADVSNLNFPQTMSKSFSAGMLSEVSSQEKSKHAKESFILKKEMQNAIPAIHYETLGNKDLKCDEKICKLDIDTEVIKEIKNRSSDGASHSAKPGSSMTIDDGSKAIGSVKSTSLTAGASSEIKDFTSVDVDKGSSIIPIIRNFETVREKENINLMQKGGGSSGSNATFGTFKARPLLHGSLEVKTADADNTSRTKHNIRNKAGDGNATSSKGVNRKIDIVDVKENNNEERSLGDKSLPLKKMLNHLEKIEHPCQQGSLRELVRTVGDENMSQSSLAEQTESAEHSAAGEKNNGRIWSGHGDATSSEGVNRKAETIDVNENNNEEQSIGEKYLPLKKMVAEPEMIKHPCQQGTSVEVAKTINDENILQSPTNEQAAPRGSYGKAEALKSGYSSVCPIEILNTWTPRHLCITTGSKLLRDFAESCTVTSEINPIESSSMREDDSKQQKVGDACEQGNESKVLRSSGKSCIENSPSSLKSNGGFIEQGVRIVVIIVACGLLLKAI